MLMEHHHTQGRPTWTSSLYSTTTGMSGAASSSSSLPYEPLRPPAYDNESPQYQQQDHPPQHYPQDQDNHYRYPYEGARPTLDPRGAPFAPLPPPPRDDGLPPSRLPFPAPGLPRPMIGGLSLDKSMGVATPAFAISKPGGPATPKRATDEERRAKHREAQRRFVKRKKIEMMQLKQLAVELEKRHDLLQVVSEREALTRENESLVQQLESQKQKAQEAQESPTSTHEEQKVDVKQEANPVDPDNKENNAKKEERRQEIQWETRTFEW